MRRRSAAAVLAVVAFVTVPLASCIGGDDDPDPNDGGSGEAVDGGVVRLGIGGPLVVDPVEASLASASDLMVLDLLHDGLTRMDAEGVVQPALAVRWQANAAMTSFRFRLGTGVTFASGRPVTADDVIASLERVMAAGDTSLVALSLESVVGFRDFVDGSADHVRGLSAPDEGSVRIQLTTPLSVLPEVLSSPALGIVDPTTISGGLADLDVSGAWSVASADDDLLALERRDGATRSLHGIEVRAFEGPEAAFEAFEDGDVDWAPVPSTQFGQAVEEYGDDAFAPFQAELYFGMNLSSPPLRQPALRDAVVAAIDRDAIVSSVYRELADPLAAIVPAGVAGHDPDRCRTCAHDPERAREIVTFAYPDGEVPTIRIDFDESAPQEAMARIVAANLEDVGIPTELRPKPLEEYKRFVVSGDQELFSFGWIGAYRSPDGYLAPLFGSAANDNLTDYRSARVDGYLQRARASDDVAKNAQRWALAERTVLEDAVVVPIAQFRTQVVVADRVQGLVHAVDGSVDWSQVTLTA
jgi:ABC-type transport system substrate-binding protein